MEPERSIRNSRQEGFERLISAEYATSNGPLLQLECGHILPCWRKARSMFRSRSALTSRIAASVRRARSTESVGTSGVRSGGGAIARLRWSLPTARSIISVHRDPDVLIVVMDLDDGTIATVRAQIVEKLEYVRERWGINVINLDEPYGSGKFDEFVPIVQKMRGK